jgi:hypothetical protein
MRLNDTFGGRNLYYLAGGCAVLLGMVALVVFIAVFFVAPVIQPRQNAPTVTPAVIDDRCRLIPARMFPAYFAPRANATFWADLNANEAYFIIARASGGWYGFIPGSSTAPPGYSLNQLRWANPAPNQANLTGNCDRVPLIDPSAEPTIAPVPTFPQFASATPGSNDLDGDGIPDVSDLCPDEPGDIFNQGCSPSG